MCGGNPMHIYICMYMYIYIYMYVYVYIYMVKSKKWCPNGFFGNTIVQTPATMFLFFLLYPPTLGLSGEQYFCICRSVN